MYERILTILSNKTQVKRNPNMSMDGFIDENEDALFDEIYNIIKKNEVEDCYWLYDTTTKQYRDFRQFFADYYDEIREQMQNWYWELLDENSL